MSKKHNGIGDDLAKNNTLVGDDTPTNIGGNNVYVFANLPTDQSFKLGNGQIVTINGLSVSSLRRPDGGFYRGGKYGVTPINRDAWAEVVKVYGNMRMFKSGIVFAADTLERGQAMARERGDLRHGYEPVDPDGPKVKSKPHTKD